MVLKSSKFCCETFNTSNPLNSYVCFILFKMIVGVNLKEGVGVRKW